MATLRPMAVDDLPEVAVVWHGAFGALRSRLGLPALPRTPSDDQRLERRLRHLVDSDPDGSWVSEESGGLTGLAQAFIRDGLWVLSLLGVSPQYQGHGTARALLEQALDYGKQGSPGMIQASADPKAIALYAGAGFALHPSVAASAPVRNPVAVPDEVRTGGPPDLDLVDVVDREIRGAVRGDLIAHLLSVDDHRLLVDGSSGYAVVKDDRVVTLGALDEASASRLLLAAMAQVPPGESFQVNWITADQQWAVRSLVAAGVPFRPSGPVMLRNMVGPPTPYIPSGGLG